MHSFACPTTRIIDLVSEAPDVTRVMSGGSGRPSETGDDIANRSAVDLPGNIASSTRQWCGCGEPRSEPDSQRWNWARLGQVPTSVASTDAATLSYWAQNVE